MKNEAKGMAQTLNLDMTEDSNPKISSSSQVTAQGMKHIHSVDLLVTMKSYFKLMLKQKCYPSSKTFQNDPIC